MKRNIVLLCAILALLVTSAVAFAGPITDGCYVDAPSSVNEGEVITVTIKCDNIPDSNNVFGFQVGTTPSGEFVGSAPLTYTPGTFTSAATGGTLVGSNSLALYGVSRKLVNVVTATSFTLGSYTLTAVTTLGAGVGVVADGSVTVDFNTTPSGFNLSDDHGLSLGFLRTDNDSSTVVNDIDLAWLSGNVTVQSDSTAIGHIKNVDLNLGGKDYPALSIATSDHAVLVMRSADTYIEQANGVVGGTFAIAQDSDDALNIAVTADMWGHKACSTSVVNLGDAGTSEDVGGFVGTLGIITLKAGDANMDNMISNTDAVAIGLDFGKTGGAINSSTENDINLDNTVNILDLVQVGRNFETALTVSACS